MIVHCTNQYVESPGNKRGSGGEIPESPLSDMHSLRGEYDLMMPPPSQRRKTSGMDSGNALIYAAPHAPVFSVLLSP